MLLEIFKVQSYFLSVSISDVQYRASALFPFGLFWRLRFVHVESGVDTIDLIQKCTKNYVNDDKQDANNDLNSTSGKNTKEKSRVQKAPLLP